MNLETKKENIIKNSAPCFNSPNKQSRIHEDYPVKILTVIGLTNLITSSSHKLESKRCVFPHISMMYVYSTLLR